MVLNEKRFGWLLIIAMGLFIATLFWGGCASREKLVERSSGRSDFSFLDTAFVVSGNKYFTVRDTFRIEVRGSHFTLRYNQRPGFWIIAGNFGSDPHARFLESSTKLNSHQWLMLSMSNTIDTVRVYSAQADRWYSFFAPNFCSDVFTRFLYRIERALLTRENPLFDDLDKLFFTTYSVSRARIDIRNTYRFGGESYEFELRPHTASLEFRNAARNEAVLLMNWFDNDTTFRAIHLGSYFATSSYWVDVILSASRRSLFEGCGVWREKSGRFMPVADTLLQSMSDSLICRAAPMIRTFLCGERVLSFGDFFQALRGFRETLNDPLKRHFPLRGRKFVKGGRPDVPITYEITTDEYGDGILLENSWGWKIRLRSWNDLSKRRVVYERWRDGIWEPYLTAYEKGDSLSFRREQKYRMMHNPALKKEIFRLAGYIADIWADDDLMPWVELHDLCILSRDYFVR